MTKNLHAPISNGNLSLWQFFSRAQSKEAQTLGVEYYPLFDMGEFLATSDIIIIAVPMIDFEDVVLTLPAERLRGKLVVEVCPLSAHPKAVLLRHFGPEVDILSTHPLFGPSSSRTDPYASPSWDGRPLVYEKVRIIDAKRCDNFLSIFEEARCQLVEMTAEQHDASTADAEFVTHLTGRLLDPQLLPPTPVTSKEYAALCDVADMTSGDSFDLFFGMFKFNERAKDHLNKMRDNLARVERQLAAKEGAFVLVSVWTGKRQSCCTQYLSVPFGVQHILRQERK